MWVPLYVCPSDQPIDYRYNHDCSVTDIYQNHLTFTCFWYAVNVAFQEITNLDIWQLSVIRVMVS